MKIKEFKTYDDQVALLQKRGMIIDDYEKAVKTLQYINYYRLSGYWYPLHIFSPQSKKPSDTFQDGVTFDLVLDLYNFDDKLRRAIFSELSSIELAMRALLGHELGRISPDIHLHKDFFVDASKYDKWLSTYEEAQRKSHEDFVKHHEREYAGILPIWAAVEIMDWGLLSHLYSISPRPVRDTISQHVGLTSPQLASWLKSLNVLRNYSAHHARLFNRVFAVKPKTSNKPELVILSRTKSRLFGQLTTIQYLHKALDLSPATTLPKVLDEYPHNSFVPFTRTGAPTDWKEHPLWH